MNSLLVRSLLTALARLGVHEVCVAAGARNAPIITSLLASDGVKLWHFFEERCAAFFALGRIMADHAPVAVITTSGTAAAELLPAVIEAHYQGLPLIVITADRPRRFRGTGAPQTIEQPGLFGPYVSASLDLANGVSISWPTLAGLRPLHLNVCLEEPLDLPSNGIDFDAVAAHRPTAAPAATVSKIKCSTALPTAILASGLHPHEARDLAPWLAALNLPIVAEATANLWSEPSLAERFIAGGEKALAALNPIQVIRVGGVPSWTWWRELENRPEIGVINLSRLPFPGLARTENVQTVQWSTLPPAPLKQAPPPAVVAKKKVSSVQARLDEHPHSDPAWMRTLAQALPAGARVLLGNSLPIREFNFAASGLATDLEFFANRGANGIDGLVSTFLGLSASARDAWLILGDLSALYDLAAPWVLSQLPRAKRRIVVINNGGGKIFARVPSLNALSENARIIIENQHSLSFKPWAQLWQIDYRLVTKAEHLNDLPDGPILLEVRPDTRQTEAFYRTPS